MRSLTRGNVCAKTDALHDFQVENALTPEQCREKAKDQCAVFYARYRDKNPAVMSITEAAKEIGCPRHIISAMAQAGHTWSVLAQFKQGNRAYKARIVNVDKCREVLNKRARRSPKAPKEKSERPPANMIKISVLAKQIAMNPNTLFVWVKRKEVKAAKYISETRKGRNALQWHADRNEVIALFRTKRACPYGKPLRRILSTPVTPLIARLWGLPLDPEPVS